MLGPWARSSDGEEYCIKAPATIETDLRHNPNSALALNTVLLRKLAHESVELVLEHPNSLRGRPGFSAYAAGGTSPRGLCLFLDRRLDSC
jgi:hypothetical protein